MKHEHIKYIRIRDGAEVTASEAHDIHNGVLKNGYSMRTSLQFMDSLQKSVAKDALTSTVKYGGGKLSHSVESDDPDEDDETDDAMLVTDGTTNRLALNKPGFRYHAKDSVAHAEQTTREALLADAYAEHDAAEAVRYMADGSEYTGGSNYNTGAGAPGKNLQPARPKQFGPEAEGTRCTFDPEEFPNFSGRGIVVKGRCVPLNFNGTDAAATAEDCYAEYDAAAATQYLKG
jgi:hypothetical protein